VKFKPEKSILNILELQSKIGRQLIITITYTTYAVVKLKPEKKIYI